MTSTLLRKASRIRETRAIPFRAVELRDGDGGTVTFAGYACVTGESYRVSDWLGDYDEVIEAGAFGKALAEADDVRLLVNHDGVPLARTKSGTLSLREDETGLWCEAELDGASPLVQTIRSAMQRGDLSEMSFAFSVVRQSWSPDYGTRTIAEVRLYDVSVVTYPANPATSASLRSAALATVSRYASVARLEALVIEARAGKALSSSNLELLEQVLGGLRSASEDLGSAHGSLDVLLEQHRAADDPADPAEDEDDEVDDDESDEDSEGDDEERGMDLALARAHVARVLTR